MKKCPRCKLDKPFSDFAKKKTGKNGLQARCRVCHSIYTRKHYEKNKKYYKDKARKNDAKYIKRSANLINEKRDRPCMDCKKTYPICVMEFDHISDDKLYNVSETKVYSIDTIKKEMAKCEVVCANCHRIRTEARRNK